MEKQNIIILSLAVIGVCIAAASLSRLSSPPSFQNHIDAVFTPKNHNSTEFDLKQQIVSRAIANVLSQRQDNHSTFELVQCQNLNKKLTWQLLVNFIKSSKGKDQLEAHEQQWQAKSREWEILRSKLQIDLQEMSFRISNDSQKISTKDQEITRLQELLSEAQKKTCPPSGDCSEIEKKYSKLQSLFLFLENRYNTTSQQLAICTEKLSNEQGKEQALCLQLHAKAASILQSRINQLSELASTQTGTSKQNLLTLINSIQESAGGSTEQTFDGVETLLGGLVSELNRCAAASEKRQSIVEQCLLEFESAVVKLQECEEKLSPFIKK